MNRSGVRHALFGTLPGRAIVVSAAVRLAIYAASRALGREPGLLGVVDAIASVGLAAGAVYFAWQLVVLAKRRLLWRVRRKLILSYVFIGFIPVVLIALFFLLSGFLLVYHFSSYLVQSRLRTIGEQARFQAQSAAAEIVRTGGRDAASILERRQANGAQEYPGLSVAVVPAARTCAGGAPSRASSPASERHVVVAGPWAHVQPPATVPEWIGCDGVAGVLAYSAGTGAGSSNDGIVVRAAAFPDSAAPAFAVVYDVPVGAVVRDRLRAETGVTLRNMTVVREAQDARPLAGRVEIADAQEPSSATGFLSSIPSVIEYRDWTTGRSGVLLVTIQLGLVDFYDQLSSGSGLVSRRFGQGLLLALLIIGGLFVVIEALALVAGFTLARSITGSVHELFTGTERVRRGDFTHKIAVTARDQLGELAQSFNSMTASIEDLLREQAEKKRLEEELRIAREIQMSLLPQGPVAMPGVSIAAACVPAREVGGDYYDFLPLDDCRFGVLIADVAGKGTSAALYMAELKGLVLSLSRIHTSPRELLMSANRIIASNLDARSFITMTYAVIDLKERTMTYARAGHTPLMYVPGGAGARTQVLAPDGMVVGLKLDDGKMFDRLLREQTMPLRRGDLYVFFTDGVSEAMNAADDCFGETRLAEILQDHAGLPAEELRERILRDVAAFAGDAPQHDDMTMILMKVDA